MKGLTTLEKGEEWLLEPKQDPKNPNLWSPGIKLGVKEGSFTHKNELFGPVLALMRADNLAHAVKIANATPYGLTSGLHSLDERESEYWIEHILAGNCYINRTITGAIVQRQPFGGCKESCFGPGTKAGGPNYLIHLMKPEQVSLPKEREPTSDEVAKLSALIPKIRLAQDEEALWKASIESYAYYWNHCFSKQHDPSMIVGQDNVLYYVPHELIVLRVNENDRLLDVLRAIAAAITCGTHPIASALTGKTR